MEKYTALKSRAESYKNMLEQVDTFRNAWSKSLRKTILKHIKEIAKQTGLDFEIQEQDQITGLGIISLKMGLKKSGLYEEVRKDQQRDFFKDFGTLNYSQLFNGKVQVWMTFPVIEGLMEPAAPKLLGIYGPPEFKESMILTDFERFLKELIEWEDYDDDDTKLPTANKIGFGSDEDKE